ncbi:MAG: rod shape-determining protein [Planctomycetes bacterium]|nr:rod shape-determining protein [Planctomycetota bacterium]
MHVDQLEPVAPCATGPRYGIVRVGLDLGFHSTVIQAADRLGELLLPRTWRIPTWAVPSPTEDECLVFGEEALRLRDAARLVHPLETSDAAVLEGFAEALQAAVDPGGESQLWAVVGCPQGAAPEQLKRLRAMAHHAFDRIRLLDPALLMATSFGSNEVARHSIWIDMGSSAVRVTPIHGGSPEPGEAAVIPGGGRAVDMRLGNALLKRFPDLRLTDVTLAGIKERFAHVPPVVAKCNLRIRFRASEQVIDIAEHVRRACEPVIGEVLDGLRRVLASCPSDAVEEMLANIVIAGGGARMAGVQARLIAEVRDRFSHEAVVRLPEDPNVLVANGALRWAHFLREEDWEIPLFRFS